LLAVVGCGRSHEVDVDVTAGALGSEFSFVGRAPTVTDVGFIQVKRTDGDPSSTLLCEVPSVSTKRTPNARLRFVYESYPVGCATLGAMPCRPLAAGGSYSVAVYDIRHDRPHGGLRFKLDAAGNVADKAL
jgi:hypothetical protein